MGTVGTLTIDLNNIRDSINGATNFTGLTMKGLAAQGSSVGTILGVAILIGIVAGVLAALFGLIKIPLGFAKEFSS